MSTRATGGRQLAAFDCGWKPAALAVAIAAAGAAALPLAAAAQQSDARAERPIEEVVVTARRRDETLQEVPIAVTAFSGERLAELGAADLSYLKQSVPNVTIEAARSTNTTLTAFIRGVGQQDPVAGFEPGVGLYIDDVYLNRPQGALLDIYDVERIEVLRGPQGTLYGRNTIGGAIKYVTRRLGPEPEASLKVTGGSYRQFDVVGTFGLPVTDTFRVGGAFARLTRDGFGKNLVQQGVENYNKDVLGGRLSFEWDVSPDILLRVAGDWTEDESDPRNGHRLLPSQFPGSPEFPVLDNVFDTRANLDSPKSEVRNRGVSASLEWAIDERWTVRNILAWRDSETGQQIDFDSLPVSDMEAPYTTEDDQWSQELQVLFSDGRVDALLGFYYLDASAGNEFDVILGQTGDLIGLPGLNAYTFGKVDTETWSVFGDVTIGLADLIGVGNGDPDVLSLSLGGRYTSDKRSARILRQTMLGNSASFGGPNLVIATTSDFEGRSKFTEFTPRVSLAWRPVPAHNFYLSWSEGFKGGSFDPRGATTAAPDLDGDGVVSDDEILRFMRFEPETIETWEVGIKSSWWNGRVTTNIALFTSDYKDVQIPGSIGVDTTGDGIADTFAGVTTNAGKASLDGIEFEGTALLAMDTFTAGDAFSFTWGIGYLDADYDEFIIAVTDPATGETSLQDVSDERNIQNTPKWTASLTADYRVPLAVLGREGEVAFIHSLAYRGSVSQFEVSSPIDQGSYWLYDASVVWTSADGRIRAGIHGKNLTDKEYRVSGYDFLNIPSPLGLEGNVTGFYGNPRTISGTIEYRF